MEWFILYFLLATEDPPTVKQDGGWFILLPMFGIPTLGLLGSVFILMRGGEAGNFFFWVFLAILVIMLVLLALLRR